MKFTLFTVLLLCNALSFGQITVQNTLSPKLIIQDVLLGSGITSFNESYGGNAELALASQLNVSAFTSSSNTFPINSGVLLTTGSYQTAVGPNSSGGDIESSSYSVLSDADLNQITTGDIQNGVILEFDFTAISDTFSFKYMFASEEYNEFVGSPFNDVFAFFLSGPGITGSYSNNAVNLALLPSSNTASNTVSINNVNLVSNPNYYVNNENSEAYGDAIQYDGTTKLLTTGAKLVCGETYHIKLCLANVGDQGWGSAVFIESKSFSATDLSFSMPEMHEGILLEDCPNGNNSILLTRPHNQENSEMVINLSYSGTATNGIDCESLPSTIHFDLGKDTISFPIQLIDDQIVENTEYLVLQASYVNICGFTITFSDTIFMGDPIPVEIKASDSTFFCPSFLGTVKVLNGLPPFTYLWSTGDVNDSLIINSTLNPALNLFTVEVTDACGNSSKDTSTITYLPVIAGLSASSSIFAVPASVEFLNSSTNADNFDWNFGNGLSTYSSDYQSQNSLYGQTGYYTINLKASKGLCTDSAKINIFVTDFPKVIPPNVFSPNGDGINDLYFMTTSFVKNLSVSVLDRWGQILFEENGENPGWNGLDKNGNTVSDGVYFYRFKALGYIGEPIEGHGFVEVVGK